MPSMLDFLQQKGGSVEAQKEELVEQPKAAVSASSSLTDFLKQKGGEVPESIQINAITAPAAQQQDAAIQEYRSDIQAIGGFDPKQLVSDYMSEVTNINQGKSSYDKAGAGQVQNATRVQKRKAALLNAKRKFDAGFIGTDTQKVNYEKGMYDYEGEDAPNVFDRIKYAFSIDPEETVQRFQKDFPKGLMQVVQYPPELGGGKRIFYTPDALGKDPEWIALDEDSVSFGDLADIVPQGIVMGFELAATKGMGQYPSVLNTFGKMLTPSLMGEAAVFGMAERMNPGERTWERAWNGVSNAFLASGMATSTVMGAKLLSGLGSLANLTTGAFALRKEDIAALENIQFSLKSMKSEASPVQLTPAHIASESGWLRSRHTAAISQSSEYRQHVGEKFMDTAARGVGGITKVQGLSDELIEANKLAELGQNAYAQYQNRWGSELNKVYKYHPQGFTPTKFGESLKRAEQEWTRKQQDEMTLRRGNVIKIAEDNNLRFDLNKPFNTSDLQGNSVTTSLVEEAKKLRKGMVGEYEERVAVKSNVINPATGRPFETYVIKKVPVQLQNPLYQAMVREIDHIIDLGKNPNVSFKEIDKIRGNLGEMIKDYTSQEKETAKKAKWLYKVLMDSYDTPVNKNIAAGTDYARELTILRQTSHAFFDLKDQQAFRKILRTDDPAQVGRYFSDPKNFTHAVVSDMFKHADAKTVEDARVRMQMNILMSDDPMKELEKWSNKVDGNPEVLTGFIFGKGKVFKEDPDVTTNFMKAATYMQQWKNGGEAAVLKEMAENASNGARLFFSGKVNPKDVEMISANMKQGDRDAYRRMIFDYNTQTTLSQQTVAGSVKHGEFVVDNKKLNENIRMLKESGAWDSILTKEDKRLLNGWSTFANRIFGQDMSDNMSVVMQTTGGQMGTAPVKSGITSKIRGFVSSRILLSPVIGQFLVNTKPGNPLIGGSRIDLAGQVAPWIVRFNLVMDAGLHGNTSEQPGGSRSYRQNRERVFKDYVTEEAGEVGLEDLGGIAAEGVRRLFKTVDPTKGIQEVYDRVNDSLDEEKARDLELKRLQNTNQVPNPNVSSKQSKYDALFAAAEQKYDIPKGLVKTVAYQESRWNPSAIGPKTKHGQAVGMMQIMPKFHPGVNYHDPNQAVDYGASYLKRLYNKYGSWKLAVAAYNTGPGNVDKAGLDIGKLPRETRNYVAFIFGGGDKVNAGRRSYTS